MPWDLILKKNLLKSVFAGLVNSAWDPHKKHSPFTNANAFCIQTNTLSAIRDKYLRHCSFYWLYLICGKKLIIYNIWRWIEFLAPFEWFLFYICKVLWICTSCDFSSLGKIYTQECFIFFFFFPNTFQKKIFNSNTQDNVITR